LDYSNIIIGLLALFFIVQIYYYLRYFTVISFGKMESNKRSNKLPVSVIIAARNESSNLQEYLDSILTQDYPNYEVIVVNDCSYDNSTDVLKGFTARYKHLKVVELEEDDKYKHGKKFALTLGIKAASHEHLLFTDADCQPVSKNWINSMQNEFSEEKEIVIGHSPYFKGKGFINAFARFETFFTALQYLSFAVRKNPYMAVGRNMAYTKSLFFKGKGFASHMHLMSGDDDLFIQQNATAKNTAVCLSEDSFVYSPAKSSLSDYVRQKFRHLRDGKEYKSSHKFSLSMITLSAMLFYVTLTIAFILMLPYEFTVGFLLIRIVLLGIFYFNAMRRLGLKDIFPFYIIFDILYFLIIPIWAVLALFTKQKRWK